MLSLRVGKSVFFYFNRELADGYLQLGLTACLFIGPLLYFFVRVEGSAEAEQPRLRRQLWTTVGALGVTALVVGAVYPYGAEPGGWHGIVKTIYAIWCASNCLAIYAGRDHFRRVVSWTEATTADFLIVSATTGSLTLVVIYNFVHYTSYIAGALAFSVLLYSSWMALALFRQRAMALQISTPAQSLPASIKPPKKKATLPSSLAEDLTRRLTTSMETDRPPSPKHGTRGSAISNRAKYHLLLNHPQYPITDPQHITARG